MVKMVEMGAYVADNKLITTILRQEENEKRTRQMQAMYVMINTASFDALRRLSWELAENYFNASVAFVDEKDHKKASQAVDDAI